MKKNNEKNRLIMKNKMRRMIKSFVPINMHAMKLIELGKGYDIAKAISELDITKNPMNLVKLDDNGIKIKLYYGRDNYWGIPIYVYINITKYRSFTSFRSAEGIDYVCHIPYHCDDTVNFMQSESGMHAGSWTHENHDEINNILDEILNTIISFYDDPKDMVNIPDLKDDYFN